MCVREGSRVKGISGGEQGQEWEEQDPAKSMDTVWGGKPLGREWDFPSPVSPNGGGSFVTS